MSRTLLSVAFAALLLAAAAVQIQAARVAVAARQLHTAAGVESRAWDERLRDARQASELRPDVVAYWQRAASLQAARYVEIGALEKARALLIDAWERDRSAVYLREQLREVNGLILANDSRKAHVLHGREGPGGALDPDDLMP